MSKKGDFKVGDRVEAPDKKKGTVQFVGTVHWTRGTWVGVEYDDAVGKHDGTDHNKRYFKCDKGHGIIQKASYWKKINDKKGGGKKGKGGKKDSGGKKGKGGGKKGKAPKEEEPTPPPPKPKVITTDTQVQTDPPEETMSNQYLCKLISRMYQDKLDKVTQQRDDYQRQLLEQTSTDTSKDNELTQLRYEVQMKTQDIEKLTDQMEELTLVNEDLKVQVEMLQMDVEEAREKLEDNFEQFKGSLSMDDQQKAEIVKMNEELQKTIESVFNSGIEAISQKDKTIFDLTADAGYMGTLTERVSQLLAVEREVVQLRNEIKELRDTADTLRDAERMVKELTEANNDLEGELHDWREYVLDVDNERSILEELHNEDEELIKELRTYGQRVSADFAALSKKYGQKDVEISDMQKELFKLRMEVQQINSAQESGLEFAEITSSVDSSGADTVTTGGVLDPAGGKKLQVLVNENVSLKAQLKQVRSILIRQVSSIINGKADYVHQNILSLYFPKTLQIDVMGINALKTLERSLYKAGIARGLLERFYADPSSASLKNPNLARQAYYLCPLILEQENYVRALQKGLISCRDEEVWKTITSSFGRLSGLERPYNVLLEHIDSATLEEYNDADLQKNKKELSEFVKKHFASLDIEADLKDEERCEKPKVLLMMSETHYRFQNLSLRLNEFNSKMHKIVHAPAQTTSTITSQLVSEDAEDAKDDESKTSEDPAGTAGAATAASPTLSAASPVLSGVEIVNAAINSLHIGVIEKMFKLRNTLLEHLREIISKSQPIDLGFRTKFILGTHLSQANRTQVKYAQLKLCKTDARKAVERIEEMLKKLSQVSAAMAPRERVTKINKIFEDEEEHNADGLLNVLDSAYSNVAGVKTIVASSVNSTLRSTDELPDISSDEKTDMKEKNDFPLWEVKAANIRDKIDEAGQIRQDMEKMKVDMAQQRQQVFDTQKTLEEQRNIISTLNDQRTKEKAKVTDLGEAQKRTAELEKENEKYRSQNTKLEKENKEHLEKIRENNELIKKYKKSMEKIKDKQLLGGKPSTRTLDLDTGFSGRSRTNSRADTREGGRGVGIRSLSPGPKSPGTGQRRSIAATAGLNLAMTAAGSGAVSVAAGVMSRGLLGVGAAGALANYYDEEDASYSELLQETIQTLRRKVAQLTMKNKIVNCDLGLKPLPVVSIKKILNDPNKANAAEDQKEEKKEKKKKTRKVKKKVMERRKKAKPAEEDAAVTTAGDGADAADGADGADAAAGAGAEEDEYEEVEVEIEVEEEYTDDEADDEAESKAKEAESEILKQNSEILTNALKGLTSNLNELRARPVMVDIAKKSFGGQDLIGRQFKLRDIHLQYLNLQEDIRKAQAESGVDDVNDENKTLGAVLGKVSLPATVKSAMLSQGQKVRITPQRLDDFKQSFL